MVFLFFTIVSSREKGHKPRDGSTRASDPDERQNAKIAKATEFSDERNFRERVDAIKRALATRPADDDRRRAFQNALAELGPKLSVSRLVATGSDEEDKSLLASV